MGHPWFSSPILPLFILFTVLYKEETHSQLTKNTKQATSQLVPVSCSWLTPSLRGFPASQKLSQGHINVQMWGTRKQWNRRRAISSSGSEARLSTSHTVYPTANHLAARPCPRPTAGWHVKSQQIPTWPAKTLLLCVRSVLWEEDMRQIQSAHALCIGRVKEKMQRKQTGADRVLKLEPMEGKKDGKQNWVEQTSSQDINLAKNRQVKPLCLPRENIAHEGSLVSGARIAGPLGSTALTVCCFGGSYTTRKQPGLGNFDVATSWRLPVHCMFCS